MVGRFINADAFVSTGQGFIGYNMFAYCNNDPVNYADESGSAPGRSNMVFIEDGARGLGGTYAMAAASGTATIAIGGLLRHGLEYTVHFCQDAKNEVYAFSQMLRQKLSTAKKSLPHVHHIVPVGYFSTRSETTQRLIREMHAMLFYAKGGPINRFVDPMNLMLVSAGTHATLHTDQYIAHVHSYLSATDGSREQIYLVLFILRLEIAAMDLYSIGY